MVFSSITFLFLFLPIVLAVYYIVPGRAKNIILLIASILFYAWGEPVYVILMILSILLNYFCGQDIEGKSDDPVKAKRSVIFAVVVNVLIPTGSCRCRSGSRSIHSRACPMFWIFIGKRSSRRKISCILLSISACSRS